MLENHPSASRERKSVAVEIALDDGSAIVGNLVIDGSSSLFKVLAGSAAFLEIEPFDGKRRVFARSDLTSIKLLAGARPVDLAQRTSDLDGFDPFAILGVKPGQKWEDVRAAYLKRAKTYHPDRFASVDLPVEVDTYLTGMLKRVNRAYAALDAAHRLRKGTQGHS